jgi:small nuclear ribonucleoprotein (snRNP)-like protein
MDAALSGTDARIVAVAPNDPSFTYEDDTIGPPYTVFAPGDGCGLIETRRQEFAGPLPDTGGYDPCQITVADEEEEGIWEIHFISPDPDDRADPPVREIVATDNTDALPQADDVNYVTAWDVTVRAANGAEKPGRAFANYLALNMGGNSTNNRQVFLDSQVFVQTRDGATYNLDLNGIDPYGFLFFANNKGFKDSEDNPIYRSLQFIGSSTSGSIPGTDSDQLGDDGYTIHNPSDRDTNGSDANPDINVTHKLFFQNPDSEMPDEANRPGSETDWLYRDYSDPIQIENFEPQWYFW